MNISLEIIHVLDKGKVVWKIDSHILNEIDRIAKIIISILSM